MTVYKPVEIIGDGFGARTRRGWSGMPLWLATYYEALEFLADIAEEGVDGYIMESDCYPPTYKYEHKRFVRLQD